MAARVWVMGKEARAYEGAADAALAALTEMPDVMDLTLTLDAAKASMNSRGNGGWGATVAGMRTCSASFDIICNVGDAVYEALRDAYLNGTQLSMAFLTGAVATADSEGPYGDFSITEFSRSEALEEGVKHSVVADLTTFKEWIEDGAEAV